MAHNIDAATLDLKETVVVTRRVSKTVKGGRIMRFAAVVVVGDQNGHVGYGLGKSAEVPEAIRKAIEEIFNVSVESVNTVSVKGHKKSQNTKQGRTVGKTNDYKKAIVTLKADSKAIAFFESLS